MEKITVIVPVYNVEKYLKKCLISIIEQTYKNLEIILINDASTDNSLEICRQFELVDNRFVIINNKINKGISFVRNIGINNCTSKYLIFIDSDDYIEKNMIEYLYNNLITYNADISTCGINNIYTNSTSSQSSNSDLLYIADKKLFLKDYLLGENIPGSLCNKLIKKELLKNLNFPIGKIYEDAFFHYDLIETTNKYVVSTKPLYNYYHRGNSITTKPFSSKDMAYIEIYQKFYDKIINQFPELEDVAFFRLAYAHFFLLDKLLLLENFKQIYEYTEIIKFLKKNYKKIVANKYFRKNRRIATIILKINVNLYRLLLKQEIKSNKGINE